MKTLTYVVAVCVFLFYLLLRKKGKMLLSVALQALIVAANADAMCKSGAPMGKHISFARPNPAMCSGTNAGSNVEVCNTLSIDDTSADRRETIKVNGGSKTYVASSLTVAKGTVFHIRTTGMEIKAKPVRSTWSVHKTMYLP